MHYFSLFYYYSTIIMHYSTIIFTIIFSIILLLFYIGLLFYYYFYYYFILLKINFAIILIIFRCRYQSCESLSSHILDLCTEIRLTIAFKNCLYIKKACLVNTKQQGRLFQHYYAHYLSYYSHYFDSLLRI